MTKKLTGRIGICAVLDQKLDNFGVIVVGGNVKGGLPLPVYNVSVLRPRASKYEKKHTEHIDICSVLA
jgi:hypothetical protein